MSEKNPQTITVNETISQLLNTKQAVKYLGGIVSAERLLQRRRLYPTNPKYRKIGGQVFYLRSDLDDYVNGQPTMKAPVRPEVLADAE
ncbi:MAG: helix-turn-helix domain-containing protein [Deltaproteobacteria bacterium]|nr:helix-turn-helix domain-containing protein [Deltaproteobacteria bacterium]